VTSIEQQGSISYSFLLLTRSPIEPTISPIATTQSLHRTLCAWSPSSPFDGQKIGIELSRNSSCQRKNVAYNFLSARDY
jgi:hypothetical protein